MECKEVWSCAQAYQRIKPEELNISVILWLGPSAARATIED